MNRIDRAFERARSENRAALLVFVSCGDPDLDTTVELIAELERAGADIVELGFPHSDPIGEGPVIQAASLRSLLQGTTLAKVLEVVRRVRAASEVPITLMGYLNNVRAHGEDALVSEAADAGVDGLIVVDAPFEETVSLQNACEAKGVHRVLLVTPTTPPERLIRIAARSRGFVYCVSVTGVTGERQALPEDLGSLVRRIQRVCSTPVAVGFGISNPEQVAEVGRFADGVVVGSALVRRIADASSPEQAVQSASAFTRSLATSNRSARH